MNRKQRLTLIRIIVSAAALTVAAVLPLNGILKLAAVLIPYLIICWDVIF